MIPILVRPCDWKGTPFEHLQALPTNGIAIKNWANPDDAFTQVASAIRQTVQDLARPSISPPVTTRAMLKCPVLGDVELDGIDVTIGRAHDNIYVINEVAVSRYHAVIRKHNQEYEILDLSKNGTILNDRELPSEAAHVLRHGDSIRVGTMTFEYSDNSSIAPTLTLEASARAISYEETDISPSNNLPQQESSLTNARPGQMLKQRYCLLGKVGRGGMGMVYLAQDTQQENRAVAVKEMILSRLTRQESSQAIEQFQHEARLLASLDHPNIPAVYDHFGENDHWYLVMHFVKGQNLQKALDAAPGNKLPVDKVVRIGIELCNVLEYLHGHKPQVIFRDLKPANIMVTHQWHIYLIDFGIARHFKQGQVNDTIRLGTSGYAPPEQYGRSQTSPRSDIYSLGATLHQMLSGRSPANEPFQFQFPNLQLIDPTIPEALTELIAQMLELQEQARPASATEVKERLEKVLASQELEAKDDQHLTPATDTPKNVQNNTTDSSASPKKPDLNDIPESLPTPVVTTVRRASITKPLIPDPFLPHDTPYMPSRSQPSYVSDLDDNYSEPLPPMPILPRERKSPIEAPRYAGNTPKMPSRSQPSYVSDPDDDYSAPLPSTPTLRRARRLPIETPRYTRNTPNMPSRSRPSYVSDLDDNYSAPMPSTPTLRRARRLPIEASSDMPTTPIPRLTSRTPSSYVRRRFPTRQRLSNIKVLLLLSIGAFLGLVLVSQQFWWPTVWVWLVSH